MCFTVFFSFGSSILKNVTELTIASLLVSKYLPYWHERNSICESPWEVGGVPYSEIVATSLATFMFYYIAPQAMHMLLNTFIWGLSAPSSESKNPTASYGGQMVGNDDYRAKKDDAQNYFTIFGRTVTAGDIAKRISLLPRRLALDSAGDGDLVLHDPKFWQLPKIWWRYYLQENDGSASRAAAAYVQTMMWKFSSLFKLT